jgi:hypothetical protein
MIAAMCSLAAGIAVKRFDQLQEKAGVDKAYEAGRFAGQLEPDHEIGVLKDKIRTFVSYEEFENEQKDLRLNLAISNVYHDGATKDESDEMEKARHSHAWHSLKYRILFGRTRM